MREREKGLTFSPVSTSLFTSIHPLRNLSLKPFTRPPIKKKKKRRSFSHCVNVHGFSGMRGGARCLARGSLLVHGIRRERSKDGVTSQAGDCLVVRGRSDERVGTAVGDRIL